MGESPERFPELGEEFAGRYTVRAVLSEGTRSSRLFVATDSDSGLPVALKVVLPAKATDPEQLTLRFDREAKALSMVDAETCIDLLDYGVVDGQTLYMAFEWIDGPTLGDEIAKGPMGVGRTLNIMRQLLEVLDELHAANIIHRDIKPSHIMLTMEDGKPDRVKLLDFAIAKSWTHTAEGEPLLGDLTAKGHMMGTPRYMSPEQVVGRQVVPQSDMYSLGLVVLEMLTGEHANPGDDVVAVVQRHLSDEDFELPDDIPEDLFVALRRMLAKPLNARPSSATEVLDILGPLADAAEATANDETIPIGSFVAAAQVQTDPSAQVLPIPSQSGDLGEEESEEPTLPPEVIASLVDQVAQDETIKLPSEGPIPHPGGAVPRPTGPGAFVFDPGDTGRIAVQREDEDFFELGFPKAPTIQTLVWIGVAVIGTFIASVLLHPVLAPFGLGVAGVIYGASRVDRVMRFDREKWRVEARLWKWESIDEGPLHEVRGLTQDSGTVMMTTDDGTHTIASGYNDREALAVCQRANEWLTSRKW